MSVKRSLSPESNDHNCITNDIRQLKRFKLHSIIQELQNEEAKLTLLKKLRTSQQLSTRTNKNLTTITNGFHSPTTHSITPPVKPAQLPITNPPPPQQLPPPLLLLPPPPQQQQQQQQHQQSTSNVTRKAPNSPLLTNSNKISSTHQLEEHKTQAKVALRKHLERDLLNIPLPKPSLQDILFIPNGISLEFQPLVGLEDVVQCLSELQNDRHRLPQRFTDHAQIDQPYVCDQCGTDFTIRWWKHLNSKSSNILCDRCKKQVTRRMSKSEHSSLLKNVFISAMEQEKEIDKHFNVLIKQQKHSSRLSSSTSSSKSSAINNRQIQSVKTTPTFIPLTNHQHQTTKPKHSLSQNLPTKFPQQSSSSSSRKSNNNMIVQSPITTHGNHSRTLQHNKISMSIPPSHHHHQQQYRSLTSLPQQTKTNQTMKMSKNAVKQQSIPSSSRPMFPPNPDFINSFLSPNLVKSSNNKRRTFPNVETK
ncbi:unnamed protein product [Adineta steineri]|uniref:Transcriptional repressor p66 coiled-coil MBD2-interaction domain-containing protein n=1 Tax=Adineta steineri TaxID=433720 RepID=A0A819A9S1_9BILA|nr:unnamed protein product [Adineta steineri]CAF3780835.1 unnamed protein product [Adineta steineri]